MDSPPTQDDPPEDLISMVLDGFTWMEPEQLRTACVTYAIESTPEETLHLIKQLLAAAQELRKQYDLLSKAPQN